MGRHVVASECGTVHPVMALAIAEVAIDTQGTQTAPRTRLMAPVAKEGRARRIQLVAYAGAYSSRGRRRLDLGDDQSRRVESSAQDADTDRMLVIDAAKDTTAGYETSHIAQKYRAANPR
jgi:hypothetical protein